MGRGVAYLVFGYDGEELKALSEPFLYRPMVASSIYPARKVVIVPFF